MSKKTKLTRKNRLEAEIVDLWTYVYPTYLNTLKEKKGELIKEMSDAIDTSTKLLDEAQKVVEFEELYQGACKKADKKHAKLLKRYKVKLKKPS
ncbi:MAG TPA: hypothetical protein VFC30_06625 [Solirubrobacteraceae bacterium]|nr:hypothetical protein [Solirubrobacteraceae bacterium]